MWKMTGWLVVLTGVFTAICCSAPVTALAANTFDEGVRFNALFRFVVIPMTLFAGTFFPIEQIPLEQQHAVRRGIFLPS